MVRKIESTHSCLRFLLILAQCFGMLPVLGICGRGPERLRFRWASGRAIYSVVFGCATALNVFFQIGNTIFDQDLDDMDSQTVFGRCVALIFFTCTFITVTLFIKLAKNWPCLMRQWSEIDVLMASYGFPPRLNIRLKMLSLLVISSAVVEHGLFIAFSSQYTEHGDTFLETINLYIQERFDHIFDVVPYSLFLGVLVETMNVLSTFAWNFMDLFVMCISLTLSSRFRQINCYVNFLARKKVREEGKWKKAREDYTKLVLLTLSIDRGVSYIILLSFANNLFIIIVQLFNSLQPASNTAVIDRIYFVYSFGFLVIRTVSVVLMVSTVDSESQKPAVIMMALPHFIYNIEIERFLCQAKYDAAALTGCNLFKVRKSLILSVAGAIVTYELIILEFQDITDGDD